MPTHQQLPSFIDLASGTIDFSNARDFVDSVVFQDLQTILSSSDTFRSLRLNHNFISDTNSNYLGAVLKTSISLIQVLHLVDCDLSSYAVNTLCHALLGLRGGVLLPPSSTTSTERVCSTMEHHAPGTVELLLSREESLRSSLRDLSLAQNPRVDNGCADMLTLLIDSSTLQHLQLLGTRIQKEGGMQIADAVCRSKSMLSCELPFCAGFQALSLLARVLNVRETNARRAAAADADANAAAALTRPNPSTQKRDGFPAWTVANTRTIPAAQKAGAVVVPPPRALPHIQLKYHSVEMWADPSTRRTLLALNNLLDPRTSSLPR